MLRDRPVVLGSLHNGQDLPPFSAGQDSGVNHPGTIAGLHSPSLDASGHTEWVMDDASSQLRQRLHASYAAAELGLGHLIAQAPANAQRGTWRGSGFEANTAGWASLRAGKGALLSTTARAGSYGSAQSTQMDAEEATAQLKGANDLGQRLNAAAGPAGALALQSHEQSKSVPKFIKTVDVGQDGKLPDSLNGQEANRPGDERSGAGCPRRINSEPRCRLNVEPGAEAGSVLRGCGQV